MTRSRTVLILCMAMACCSHTTPVTAQAQRLGIPAGIIPLAAEGEAAVPVYCLDYTRPAPTDETQYQHVLTPTTGTRVTIGSRAMSLQEAIDTGKISIRGGKLTVARWMQESQSPLVLNRMPPAERAKFLQRVRIWRTLPADKRAAIERELAPEMPGDYTRVSFVNRTHDKVTINFSTSGILGEVAEPTTGLRPELIHRPSGSSSQKKLQDEIWHHENTQRQQLLADLGYYKGHLDGTFGPMSEGAVKNFQEDHGLKVSGKLDSLTESELHAQVAYRRRVDGFNARNRGKVLALLLDGHVESSHSPLYKLSNGRPGYLYRGNSFNEMLQAVHGEVARHNAEGAFLMPVGYSQTKIEGLERTLRLRESPDRHGAKVWICKDANSPLEVPEEFFSNTARYEHGSLTAPRQITSGKYEGHWEASFTVEEQTLGGRARRATVTIIARTREILVAILDALREMFAQPQLARKSPAQIVAHCQREAVKTLGIKSTDVVIRVRHEPKQSEWVRLPAVQASQAM